MVKYLKDVLGLSAAVEKQDINTPLYLREIYQFYRLTLMEKSYILMEVVDSLPSIPNIKKHIKTVEEKTDKTCVIWLKAITSYQRKKMIEENIQFIVPDSQVFLPLIGAILNERMPKHTVKPKYFTPKTQMLFIALCYNRKLYDLNFGEIAKRINCNKMTVTRAMKDLNLLNLIEIDTITKAKKIKPIFFGKELYDKGKEYLKSPVQSKIVVRFSDITTEIAAGLFALSKRTMLNFQDYKVFAFEKTQLASIKVYTNEYLNETDMCEVELWNYDPVFYAESGVVDPISLVASLKDTTDERVQMALDKMMEGYEW